MEVLQQRMAYPFAFGNGWDNGSNVGRCGFSNLGDWSSVGPADVHTTCTSRNFGTFTGSMPPTAAYGSAPQPQTMCAPWAPGMQDFSRPRSRAPPPTFPPWPHPLPPWGPKIQGNLPPHTWFPDPCAIPPMKWPPYGESHQLVPNAASEFRPAYPQTGGKKRKRDRLKKVWLLVILSSHWLERTLSMIIDIRLPDWIGIVTPINTCSPCFGY